MPVGFGPFDARDPGDKYENALFIKIRIKAEIICIFADAYTLPRKYTCLYKRVAITIL